MLPSPEVKALLAAKFVCVKVDADNPGPADKLMSQVTGNVLPFYAYATPDGRFISGTSGFRDVAVFKADLERVLGHESLKVPADAEKKLAKLAEQAAKDLADKKYAAVVKTARSAEAVRGFSPSKDKIAAAFAEALAAGRARIQEAADLCRDGKFDEAGAILNALSKDFKGTELERAAAAADKAHGRLKSAAKDASGAKKLYEAIVKDCKDAAPFVELAEARLKE